MTEQDFVDITVDDEPLLGLESPQVTYDHKTFPSRLTPCQRCTISSYKLTRFQLSTSVIWDMATIVFLVWLAENYLDPEQYECQVFMIVSFSAKSLQLITGVLALIAREKCWQAYVPYLICQAASCLALAAALVGIACTWTKIEQYAQAMTQGTISEISLDLAFFLAVVTVWKVCNWYTLLGVSEYALYVKRNNAAQSNDNDSAAVADGALNY